MRELPESWLQCKLGDVVDYGVTQKVEPTDIPADAWVLELEDIEKDTSKVLQRFTFAQRQSKSTKNRFAVGDVLYGKLRPYLNKVIRADQEGFCSTEIIPLKSAGLIHEGYLFHWLKHPEFLEYVTAVSHGLNMPRLGTEAGIKAPFVLAPLPEQKRIADKLDALLARVDACRERLDRVPLILKRFRQSVLAAATSGQLTEEWREDSEIVAPRVGNQEISFPSTWSIYKVGDVLALIDGDRGPNYPKQSDYQESGYCLFLSTKNVREFGFLFDDVVFISEQKHKSLRQGTLERGDVIITTRGTLGNVAVYDETVPYPVVRINSGMLILRKKNTEVLGNFLKVYIASPFFAQQVEEKRSGSAQPQLPAGVLKTFLFPIPPIAEQHEIVRHVETLFAFADRLEARYNAARAQVERLTPALLAKAFRGELVPQDPNDEPASVLLERIRTNSVVQAKAKRNPQRSFSGWEKEAV